VSLVDTAIIVVKHNGAVAMHQLVIVPVLVQIVGKMIALTRKP
jgi:hypothetical protein